MRKDTNKARRERAKGRNSFLLYDDFFENLKQLSDEEAGKIFKKIYEYRFFLKDPDNYPEPEAFTDRLLSITINPIKNHLRTNWENYCEECEGKARGKSGDDNGKTADGDEESG